MMHFELASEQFNRVCTVIGDMYKDPLLFAVLENRRPGRVFVDDLQHPEAAFIWTFSECSYLVGDSQKEGFYIAVMELIREELLPPMESAGETFLSVITCDPPNRERVLKSFKDRHPLSLGLVTYHLEVEAFRKLRAARRLSQDGWQVVPVDQSVLENPENEHLAGEISHYWGSIDGFRQNSLGSCVLEQGRAISWCFSEAYGAGAHSLNVATLRGYRRRGFAWNTAAAYIDGCLERGAEVAWLCDEANRPARNLVESLGMAYSCCLFPVDIPFNPSEFYLGVADHFREEFGDQQQAEAFYAIAAGLAQEG
jgi:GNAT superfamily N-acetyltransferase